MIGQIRVGTHRVTASSTARGSDLRRIRASPYRPAAMSKGCITGLIHDRTRSRRPGRSKTSCANGGIHTCDAYASWQKGGVENANGRLRRWLPRHLDIDRTSDWELQEIVVTTNLTPRKCLGFKTPFQALLAELGKDVQIRFS
jgi:IS30 family transposase